MQVVTQQPMAMAVTTWSRTICGPGCLGDCCYASWCTCCAAQQIADSMGDRIVLLKSTVSKKLTNKLGYQTEYQP